MYQEIECIDLIMPLIGPLVCFGLYFIIKQIQWRTYIKGMKKITEKYCKRCDELSKKKED